MAKLFRSGVYPTFGVYDPFDAQHSLVTSPVFPPLLLASIRLLLGLYILVFLIVSLSYDSVHFPDQLDGYFSYFTHLSYIGLCAYFWASGVQTMCHALGKGYPLQSWPRFLQFLHLLLFSTIITFPFITTIVFWALLSDSATFDTKFDAWSNVSAHALNSVFALFEILLTHAGPVPFTHLPLGLIMLALYLGVAYITHATQGFYTYSFLDPKKEHGRLAAYIVGVGVAECLLFTASWGLCKFREWLCSKRRSREPVPEDVSDDWQQVSRNPSTDVA